MARAYAIEIPGKGRYSLNEEALSHYCAKPPEEWGVKPGDYLYGKNFAADPHDGDCDATGYEIEHGLAKSHMQPFSYVMIQNDEKFVWTRGMLVEQFHPNSSYVRRPWPGPSSEIPSELTLIEDDAEYEKALAVAKSAQWAWIHENMGPSPACFRTMKDGDTIFTAFDWDHSGRLKETGSGWWAGKLIIVE